MNRERLVSICIPSYRHEKYLGASIESALAQTYPNCEIVIVDDGSPDASYEIALSYANRYPDRIRVFTHPGRENRGISATINLALHKATGVFWSGISSDDVLRPEKTELQIGHLDSSPDLHFSHGRATLIDGEGATMGGTVGQALSPGLEGLLQLVERCTISAPTVVARRATLLSVGDYHEALVFSDWEYWIRLAARYAGGYVGRDLMSYRVHGDNTSWGSPVEAGLKNSFDVMTSVAERAGEIGGLLTAARARGAVHLKAMFYAFCLGIDGRAEASLASALEADPTLLEDRSWLGGWVLRQHEDFVRFCPSLPHRSGGPLAFVQWFLGNMQRRRSAPPRWDRSIRAQAQWAVARQSFAAGETWGAARHVGRTWRGSPRLLARAGTWRIFLAGCGKGMLPEPMHLVMRAARTRFKRLGTE